MFDMMDLIFGHQGSVNKLMGDGILATFGCPKSFGDDAGNALSCALQIEKHLLTYNSMRPDYLNADVKIGIGVATGLLFSGMVGSMHHLEYTVLGDPVNVASRLQALSKQTDSDILTDSVTLTSSSQVFDVSRIETNKIAGRSGTIEIYEVNGM